jgi:hypothetical protein
MGNINDIVHAYKLLQGRDLRSVGPTGSKQAMLIASWQGACHRGNFSLADTFWQMFQELVHGIQGQG